MLTQLRQRPLVIQKRRRLNGPQQPVVVAAVWKPAREGHGFQQAAPCDGTADRPETSALQRAEPRSHAGFDVFEPGGVVALGNQSAAGVDDVFSRPYGL